MAEWEQEIDESKDYYKVLGVVPGVSNDDMKAAYVQLALAHHPDTATALEGDKKKEQGLEFIKISEAWSILSRPEIRSRYDSMRGRYLGITNFGSAASSGPTLSEIHSSIPTGFTAQKANFGRVLHHAGASMEDTQMKMRTERWHEMPLSEKKTMRTKPISTISGSIVGIIVPIVIVSGIAYVAYKSYSPKRK